jgi:hypothetical protein
MRVGTEQVFVIVIVVIATIALTADRTARSFVIAIIIEIFPFAVARALLSGGIFIVDRCSDGLAVDAAGWRGQRQFVTLTMTRNGAAAV